MIIGFESESSEPREGNSSCYSSKVEGKPIADAINNAKTAAIAAEGLPINSAQAMILSQIRINQSMSEDQRQRTPFKERVWSMIEIKH